MASLDEDRILRAFRALVLASVRTNAYRTGADGLPPRHLSFKIDSHRVPDLPLPRPWVEIFVYSADVEGVHLRGGPVARGGLRWSDRREDFRTEVLGLMKAQMVKNAVIVPVGSKGGFYVKRALPAARDAAQEIVVGCYRTFLGGLLDVTDNLVDGAVVPPPDVVRHDGDDPYLVVAADKGTATFSDHANACARDYGFWLDDAFASGGSVGYDHKKMASPRAAPGSRSSATSGTSGSTRRASRSRSSASATWAETCSATACCSRRRSGSSPRSTTCTCSSTRRRTRPPPTPSARGCSRCRDRPGRTTTRH